MHKCSLGVGSWREVIAKDVHYVPVASNASEGERVPCRRDWGCGILEVPGCAAVRRQSFCVANSGSECHAGSRRAATAPGVRTDMPPAFIQAGRARLTNHLGSR